jgi:hypothetical protein
LHGIPIRIDPINSRPCQHQQSVLHDVGFDERQRRAGLIRHVCCSLEIANGVAVAVKNEAVAAVKGEPVVAVPVELQRSYPTLLRPQIPFMLPS